MAITEPAGAQIRPDRVLFDFPFRGSDALAAGLLSRGRLRGPGFRRLFDDVYVAADVPVDLALRSRAAHLLVDGRGVPAGYSAAEILGASCGPPDAPAEVALPGGCLLRQPGLRVHRGILAPDEVTTVAGIGVTTRARTAYDLARAPSLVEAVVAVDALATADAGAPGGAFLPPDVLRLRNRHLGARNSRRLPEVVALADLLAQSPMETHAPGARPTRPAGTGVAVRGTRSGPPPLPGPRVSAAPDRRGIRRG